MAIVKLFNRATFDAWLSSRPKAIQDLAAQLPPDRLYLLKKAGHRCTIHSYSEDGTVTVHVTGDYNLVVYGRKVFGVVPADLEECDLPPADAPRGTLFPFLPEVESHPGIDSPKES